MNEDVKKEDIAIAEGTEVGQDITPTEDTKVEQEDGLKADIEVKDEIAEVTPEEAMRQLDEEIKKDMNEDEKASVDAVVDVVKKVTELEGKVVERMQNPKPDTNIMNSLIQEFNGILTEASKSIEGMVELGRKSQLDAEELQKELSVLQEMKDESNAAKITELEEAIAKKINTSKNHYESAAKIRQITEKFRKSISTADIIEEFFKTAVGTIENAVKTFMADPRKVSPKLDRPIGLFFKQANVMAIKKINDVFNDMCDDIYSKDNTILRHGMSKESFRTSLNESIKNEVETVRDYLLTQQLNYNKAVRAAKETLENNPETENEELSKDADAQEVPLELVNTQSLTTLYKLILYIGVESTEPEYRNSVYNKLIGILLNPNHRDTLITFTETTITTMQQWFAADILAVPTMIKTLTFEEAEVEVAKIQEKEKAIKMKVYRQLAEGVLAGQIAKSVLTEEQLAGIAELGYDLSTAPDVNPMPEITEDMLKSMDDELKVMEEKHGALPTNEDGSISVDGVNVKVQPAKEENDDKVADIETV